MYIHGVSSSENKMTKCDKKNLFCALLFFTIIFENFTLKYCINIFPLFPPIFQHLSYL